METLLLVLRVAGYLMTFVVAQVVLSYLVELAYWLVDGAMCLLWWAFAGLCLLVVLLREGLEAAVGWCWRKARGRC
jgi:hypothetical protein